MSEEKRKKLIDSLVVKMKGNKMLELGIYGGLALVCLLLCLPGRAEEKNTVAQPAVEESGVDLLEKRLMDTLSSVRGAGKVKVMITYETGNEIVPAMNTDITSSISVSGENQTRTESSSPVTTYQNGENEAIVLMEREPTVRGVIVVAQGAADISVRLKLQAAVQAVLGVEAEKVEVLEMGMEGMEEIKDETD